MNAEFLLQNAACIPATQGAYRIVRQGTLQQALLEGVLFRGGQEGGASRLTPRCNSADAAVAIDITPALHEATTAAQGAGDLGRRLALQRQRHGPKAIALFGQGFAAGKQTQFFEILGNPFLNVHDNSFTVWQGV